MSIKTRCRFLFPTLFTRKDFPILISTLKIWQFVSLVDILKMNLTSIMSDLFSVDWVFCLIYIRSSNFSLCWNDFIIKLKLKKKIIVFIEANKWETTFCLTILVWVKVRTIFYPVSNIFPIVQLPMIRDFINQLAY